MRNLLALFLAFLASPGRLWADEPPVERAKAETSREITIAVADFTGEEAALGRFLADTLLTDLAQSARLCLVERGELRRAIEELKLEETGLFAPPQARALGQMLRADRLIVGSYLRQDDRLLINARLLDVETGRVLPGGAATLSGESGSLLDLMHRLARQFHVHLTGEPLVLEGERREPPALARPEAEDPPRSAPLPAKPRSEETAAISRAATSREKMRAIQQEFRGLAYTRPAPIAQEKERRSTPPIWSERPFPPPPRDLRPLPPVLTCPPGRPYSRRSLPVEKPHRSRRHTY